MKYELVKIVKIIRVPVGGPAEGGGEGDARHLPGPAATAQTQNIFHIGPAWSAEKVKGYVKFRLHLHPRVKVSRRVSLSPRLPTSVPHRCRTHTCTSSPRIYLLFRNRIALSLFVKINNYQHIVCLTVCSIFDRKTV